MWSGVTVCTDRRPSVFGTILRELSKVAPMAYFYIEFDVEHKNMFVFTMFFLSLFQMMQSYKIKDIEYIQGCIHYKNGDLILLIGIIIIGAVNLTLALAILLIN